MPHSEHRSSLPGLGARSGLRRLRHLLRAPQLHNWIQTSAILIATIWGIYTFIWQDILVPSWSPAHINLQASLSVNRPSPQADGSSEVALSVKADNPSNRRLFLLSNSWRLLGSQRRTVPTGEFQSRGDAVLRADALTHVERGSMRESGPLLALGRLFDDDVLQPGESISRTLLLTIPKDQDAIELSMILPALTRQPDRQLFNGQRLEWGLSKDEQIIPLLCRNREEHSSGSGSTRNRGCRNIDPAQLQRQLRHFDERMQVFTRNDQFSLAGRSADPASQTPP